MRSKKIIEKDLVDLSEIIRKLWKEKLLILSISLIVSALAYAKIAYQPKTFQTTVVLKNIPSTLLIKFDDFLQEQQQKKITLASFLSDEFHQQLNSFDNLDQFVKQNNSINSFKALLKEQKISAKDYFLNDASKNKFGQEREKNKIIENKYYLNFPKELNGNKFLDEYVLFTFKNTQENIFKQIITLLDSEKELLQRNLMLAKKLNLQEPILQQKIQDKSLFLMNEPRELYYKGATVLQIEFENLNKLIAEAKDLKLDFDPILDRASKPIVISNNPLKYGILGFVAGLFLSLIYISLRNVLKNS